MAARTLNQSLSLREESSGKTRVNEASLLRVKHLQRLAACAGGDAGVGPVGALLGRRLAASAEAVGVPLGATTFLCQRCETVLKPGFNCTIRIKNNKKKAKQRKKSNCCQNSVSYACHFCGDQNLILGSGKGVVKSLLSSRQQAHIVSAHKVPRGDNKNTRTQDMKRVLEHSQTAILQAAASSLLIQSASERAERGEKLKPDLPKDCRIEEGLILPMLECGQDLAASTCEDDSMQKVALENVNDGGMHETEPISSKKITICKDNVSLKTEFPIGSKFVTPQKIKLTGVTGPKDSEPFETRSMVNKNGADSGKGLASSSRSAPNVSRKNLKASASDSAPLSGSSRKRARKGWTTLKQIAEKDELERKEKMGNFVIPFFMQ
ncbi:hypothetical protein ACP70R_041037 [Stipagrostis hirtigluma subsp. patula]